MDYKFSSESGLQLLARLNSRPSLEHLDDVLFTAGPNPGDVIQISGASCVGKTILVTKFISKCILPKKYENVEIGGLDVGVIFMDTDHHFSIIKLVGFMEAIISNALKQTSLTQLDNLKQEENDNTNLIEDIVRNSLKKLILLKSFSSLHFQMNIESLYDILSADIHISLILIDSISSYYWEDVTKNDSFKNLDLYFKDLLVTLQKIVQQFRMVIIFTKPESFNSKTYEKLVLGDSELGQLTYKIELKKSDAEEHDLHYALVENINNTACHYYTLNQAGLTCNQCGYLTQFQDLARAIQKDYPDTTVSSTEGSPGSFEVKINDSLVYSKLATLAFPDFNAVNEVIGEVYRGEEVRKVVKQQPITDCCLM